MGGSSLTMRNFRTTIENAIRDALLLAYRARLGSAATVAALRTRPSLALDDESLVFVSAANRVYRFTPSSTAADDGDLVLKPSDRGARPGRWVKTSSTVQTGYLKRCCLFDGRDDEASIEERLLSANPAMLLSYERTDWKLKSVKPGALQQATLEFEIIVSSNSFRGETETRQGSPFGSEASTDPGTSAMLGDARSLLTSVNLDAPFGLHGVGTVILHSEEMVYQSLAGRMFVEAIKFGVTATVASDTETDLVTLDRYGIKAQGQLADAPSGAFDLDNYSGAGWTVPTGSRVTTIASGSAIIAGVTVSIGATAHTFSASKATWRDVVAGAWVFTEAGLFDPPPAIPTGGFRVGVTYTDATSVTLDALLCSTLYNFGPADKIEPPLTESLALAPSSSSAAVGVQTSLVATATFEDGSTADVTGECDWTTTDALVATVSQIGVVTRVGVGTAQIVATKDGVASPPATITAT